MTDKKTEALKLALEALEKIGLRDWVERKEKGITAIREALAEQPPCKTGSQCTSKCPQCDEPAQQQEPVAVVKALPMGHNQPDMHFAECQHLPAGTPLYTSPQPSKPLTDEQFLEMILRTGTQELVGVATFVGGSIQMQGKIGLLRSAKIIKEFVEAAHGIKGDA